jgi:hypothetical protein
MLRKLLALLAICAGLVAVAEPARAAENMVEAVRLAERSGPACAPCALPLRAQAGRPVGWAMPTADVLPRLALAPRVATVVLRVDRSRE